MSAAKHTPGPWHVSSMTNTNGIFNASGDPVARTPVMNGEITRERRLADARLIAAAPDLLAALWEIVANDPFNQSSAVVIARAAIAKATGGAA